MKDKEIRAYDAEIEVRMDGDKNKVRGYAAVFNSESNDLGGFIETIQPGAFSNVLNDDVRALIDHKSELILGRTVSGTLRIGQDEKGLYYEYDSPNTSYANDLLESMKRGDVTQSSFGFRVARDGSKWEEKDGKTYRTITNISRLYDVSPVTYPAYNDTSVAMRSLDKLKEDNTAKVEADKIDRDKDERNLIGL
jgi:uncharacterized protein